MSISAPHRATEPASPEPSEHESTHLQAALHQRHLTMIALGGVIGAGLFVGSGAVISVTGPAAVLSYVLAGLLVVLVMRMLGEMASAHPTLGSFTDLIRRSLGEGAGFTSGWLYWYFWVIVVGFEAVAGASILQRWVDEPLWLMALGLTVLMTATNLASVRAYGEFEFWFASIKVATIIVFLLLGTAYVLGIWPDKGPSLSNLTSHGGFVPEGSVAIFSGIVVVIFSMVGAEIVTIAAAESEDPERAIAKATNAVVSRILLFFVGSIVLLVTILPWNDAKLGDSPYVAAFGVMGIPAAADIMNAVVLTAVLSCLNSGIYTASRVLLSLSRHGDAPLSLLAINRRGVPVKAILSCTGVAYVGIALAYISPDKVFLFLLNSSGAIVLFVYFLICAAQLRMRRDLERESPEGIRVRMWLYPWLTYLAMIAIVLVVGSMYLIEDSRSQFFLSFISLAVVAGAYLLRKRRGEPAGRTTPKPAVAAAAL
jgi:GABA permease